MREPPPTATHSVVEHYERTSPSRDAPPLLAGTHISVPILPAKSGNGAGAAIAAVPDIERPRVDVGGRLAGMRYRGAGEASVHHTQLSVTASLLSTGVPIAETVAQVLEATRVAAGVEGADWDWTAEEASLRSMCHMWCAKHPTITMTGAAASAVGTASREWPDPKPLPSALLPVVAFDFDLLPDKLRAWTADVTERMQCPADFVAVSLMAAAGSLIGRKVGIRPKAQDDWTETANQWAFLVGRPGVMKSPAMKEALRPIRQLEVKANETFETAKAAHELVAKEQRLRADVATKEAKKAIAKNTQADISGLLKVARDDDPPTRRRYTANDTNVASLGVLLQQNPNGLLVFRDELVSLLDALDREENVSERGFYLTAWAGDSSSLRRDQHGRQTSREEKPDASRSPDLILAQIALAASASNAVELP